MKVQQRVIGAQSVEVQTKMSKEVEMDDSYLPEEARRLPILPISGNLDIKELYVVMEGNQCRRCRGTGIDPDGEYPCLLCKGKKVEKFIDGSIKVCFKHPDKELVGIGRRFVTWEDAMGFDQEGYLEVKGCPICKVPACSIM